VKIFKADWFLLLDSVKLPEKSLEEKLKKYANGFMSIQQMNVFYTNFLKIWDGIFYFRVYQELRIVVEN